MKECQQSSDNVSLLDEKRDIPVKKAQSAYVIFGNQVSTPLAIFTCLVLLAKGTDNGGQSWDQGDGSCQDHSRKMVATDEATEIKIQRTGDSG